MGRGKEWKTAWARRALLTHLVSLVLPPQVSEEVSQELTDSGESRMHIGSQTILGEEKTTPFSQPPMPPLTLHRPGIRE